MPKDQRCSWQIRQCRDQPGPALVIPPANPLWCLYLLPGQPLANQLQCSTSCSKCSHQTSQLLSAQHFSPTQTCNLATRHSAAPALRALEWWSNDLLWQCSRYRPGYSNWIQEYIWLNKWRKKIIVVALMATCYNILVYLNIIECSQHSTKWNHRRHA